MAVKILRGDCRDILKTLPAASVHMCVTSPPYWGLRDYGLPATIWGGDLVCAHEWGDVGRSGQRQRNGAEGGLHSERPVNKLTENVMLHPETGAFCVYCSAWNGTFGLEPTYQLYVEHSVEVFQEVSRVLRDDGTLWLNLGDSYVGGGRGGGGCFANERPGWDSIPMEFGKKRGFTDLKPKNLCGIPWRVAFALQADGWYLRQDIIWSKPNPMPESVRDRCTKSHEYFFMLSKSKQYYYDQAAISEDAIYSGLTGQDASGFKNAANFSGKNSGGNAVRGEKKVNKQRGHSRRHAGFNDRWDKMEKAEQCSGKRNKRSVWEVATHPFVEAHFATFPPALIEPCIMAGCPKGGTVLDPFFGAGTTGLVADRLGRNCIGIELNPEYADMAEKRIHADAGMFASVSSE